MTRRFTPQIHFAGDMENSVKRENAVEPSEALIYNFFLTTISKNINI